MRVQVTTLLADIDSSLHSNAEEKSINVLLARLTALQTKLTEVDAAIERVVPDSDAEEDCTRTVELNDQIGIYKAKLDREVKEGQLKRSVAERATCPPKEEGTGVPSKLKLPNLELQRYGGATTEWQPFWQQFRHAVHDNAALTSSEKFLYLGLTLAGKALSAVAGIHATGENYNAAIDLLKECFGGLMSSLKNI